MGYGDRSSGTTMTGYTDVMVVDASSFTLGSTIGAGTQNFHAGYVEIDGNKKTSNLLEVINDNDGAVGDSSFVVTKLGAISFGGANTISTTAGTLNLNPNTFLGVKTATPYHTLSNYSATPVWALTNTTVNKNVTSAAQAIDSSAIAFDISGEPTMKWRASDGDAGQIQYSADDYMLFNNAIRYWFDNTLAISTNQALMFDGGSDTYMTHPTAGDVLDTYVGGVNLIKVTEGTGIDAVRILNAPLQVDSSIVMSQLSAAPTKPTAGNTRIYADNLGNIDIQDPNGVIRGTGWTPALKGMTFDGVDDYVNCGSDTDLDNIFDNGASIVIYTFLNSDGEDDAGYIINKAQWYLNTVGESGGFVRIRFWCAFTTQGQWTVPTANLSLSKWNMVVLTYNSSATANNPLLYTNGVLQTFTREIAPTGTRTSDASSNLGVGSNAGGATVDGNINFVRLYNRILSASEVLTMWNDGQPYLYQVPYADKGANQTKVATYDTSATQDITITLIAGKYFTWTKGTADSLMIGLTKYTSTSTFLYSTGTVRANGGGAGDLTGSNLLQTGNVADYQGEWAGSTSWVDKSGNNLNGVTSGSPVLTIPLPEYQYSVSQIFTTDIAASPKVLVIPANYEVQSIYIQDMGTAAGLSGISATQETSTIALITGKAVATGTGITFRTIADHNVYAVNKNLSFLATGNGSAGCRIVVTMKRAN